MVQDIISKLCILPHQLAFVSYGCAGGGHRPVCGELHKQITAGTEHSLIWQVFNFIGVIHRGRVYVVAIFY